MSVYIYIYSVFKSINFSAWSADIHSRQGPPGSKGEKGMPGSFGELGQPGDEGKSLQIRQIYGLVIIVDYFYGLN